ncbi:MAG: hypothetical protein ACYDD4_05490 [Acidimicrobiales bacterium]
MNETATAHEPAPASPVDWPLAGKIAVGFVAGAIMMGVVGPIVLAIFVGLITGHR